MTFQTTPVFYGRRQEHDVPPSDEVLSHIDNVVSEAGALAVRAATLDSGAHGPPRPQFSFEAEVAEIDRALEDGTMSRPEAIEMIDQLSSAHSRASVEDLVAREFHRDRP